MIDEERLRELVAWLRKRGEPNSGIRYEGQAYDLETGFRHQSRVELHGSDADFIAKHFHGQGARELADALAALSDPLPATGEVVPELVFWQHKGKSYGSSRWTEWREGRNQTFDTGDGDEFEERQLYAYSQPIVSPAPSPNGTISEERVEAASKAYAEATGYYVPFHRGLRSESADSIRKGIRAALASSPSPQGRIAELEGALTKLRSYNVDIDAGRINYRPLDHIAVIDAALAPREGRQS